MQDHRKQFKSWKEVSYKEAEGHQVLGCQWVFKYKTVKHGVTSIRWIFKAETSI